MVSDGNVDSMNLTLKVLILVLMEYGLGDPYNRAYGYTSVVLILVLMEYGLGEVPANCFAQFVES